MSPPLDIVVFGLTLSSSWGNGHATTYRALIEGLHGLGHRVTYLEKDVPWYAANRDLADPSYCRLAFYDEQERALAVHREALISADAVIVGSYVPDGVALIDRLARVPLRRLVFYDIDTPVTLAGLRRGEEPYLARRQIPQFDACFSFSGGPVLGVLEAEFGARLALPLHCAVDPKRYRPLREPIRWDLGYLGTYSPDRQPALERLLLEPARRLPAMHFVVAGPQYPDTIDWPANVERIAHLPPADHARFYARQRFTLNITRADMAAAGWSPSVRLFEAAACATPIVSDRWPGLTELMREGEAILIADDTEGVIGTLTGVEETERRRLGAAARQVVLSGHTGEIRAGQLARDLARIEPRQLAPRGPYIVSSQQESSAS